jgi:DNA-binding HxlR family transcriptional regulator
MNRPYKNFCPIAFALEKIGDKWSLLIIRDLLRGPQRFTDLAGTLRYITPKWLTQRLRMLEESGIVQRDQQQGRKQIWYQLTQAGSDLAPIMEDLAVWGLRHAMRPPEPDDLINPDSMMGNFVRMLNKRGKCLPKNASWLIRFPRASYIVSFEEDIWKECKGEKPDADVTIRTTPEAWATLNTLPRKERRGIIDKMETQGAPERIAEFLQIFRIKAGENSRAIDSKKEQHKSQRREATGGGN